MLVKIIPMLSIISLAFGASVQIDSSDLQGLIAKTVEDILCAERIKENERYVAVLKEVDALKERNDQMEERMKYLEKENSDKDQIICSLKTRMSGIIDNISDNGKEKVLNVSLNSQQEFLNKCQSVNNERFVNMDKEDRRERQVTPTHEPPTPRIAFSAYLTQISSNLTPGSAVKFDKVHLNDGNGYNPYTGAFTAPVSGTYLFMFQFDSRVHTFVRLTVDGANLVSALVNPHNNNQHIDNMGGNSAIIHVGIGQAVLVEVYDTVGEVASTDKHHVSTFSGVLLYPEIH